MVIIYRIGGFLFQTKPEDSTQSITQPQPSADSYLPYRSIPPPLISRKHRVRVSAMKSPFSLIQMVVQVTEFMEFVRISFVSPSFQLYLVSFAAICCPIITFTSVILITTTTFTCFLVGFTCSFISFSSRKF